MSIKTQDRSGYAEPVRKVRGRCGSLGGVCEVMKLVSVLPVLAPQQLERSARSAVMGLAVGRVWGC